MIKYFVAIMAALMNASSQMLLKKANNFAHGSYAFYIYIMIVMVLYAISFIFYSIAMKFFPITKLSPATMVGSMMLIVIGGVTLFRENLSLRHIIGLCFGIVAVVLIIK